VIGHERLDRPARHDRAVDRRIGRLRGGELWQAAGDEGLEIGASSSARKMSPPATFSSGAMAVGAFPSKLNKRGLFGEIAPLGGSSPLFVDDGSTVTALGVNAPTYYPSQRITPSPSPSPSPPLALDIHRALKPG
jgi:hypothetical protein